MSKKPDAANLMSVKEAAEALGIDPKTVRSWVKSGRLDGVVKQERIVRESILVDKASLARAFHVRCLWCGKVFESSRPEGAKFCCAEHLHRHRYEHAGPGRKGGKRRGLN